MKLGIDAREIQSGVFTGIGRPLDNFINYYLSLDNDDELVLFSQQPIDFIKSPKYKNIVIPGLFTQYWDQVKLPRAINNEGLDIFYSPYYKIPLKAECIIVSAILDLMYIIYEKYKSNLSPFTEAYYKYFGKLYAERADKILTCSQYSKKDIIDLYGIEPEKVDIIPLSISNIYRVEDDKEKIEAAKKKYGISGRYLYYIGNFKHHKNVENLIIAYRKLLPKFGDLKLVLAGPHTHLYDEYQSLLQVLSISDKVIFPGKILAEDEPHLLYNGAEAFVFPSLYEGFGIPPVEAMACGTPVVSSDFTSLSEVISSAGILIDPHSTDDIAAAVASLMTNDTLRNMFIEKGLKRAADFKEEVIAKQNYDFFNRLVTNKKLGLHLF